MSLPRFAAPLAPVLAGVILLAGCRGASSIKPAETLDQQTGMTVGSLAKPIQLVQATEVPLSASLDRRQSFAYLGPVEWDDMGTISYALWVHVAPGGDGRFADIRSAGSVGLSLDGATTPLSVIEPPALARGPYRPVAPWGQTAYFGLDLAMLRRMASSARIELDIRSPGGSFARFSAAPDAAQALARYLHARGY